MRKVTIALIVLILLISFIIYNNGNPKAIISNLAKKGAIRSGDLVYAIHLFGFLPIGEAIIKAERKEEYNGSKAYHLHAAVESSKVFSKFFSGSATLDSYLDTKAFSPLLFKQKVAISGKPPAYKEVTYDQKNGIMTLAGVKRQIPFGTQDPLSLIFNIRKMDFDTVKKIEANINTNQKNYILEGVVLQDTILINKQTYHTASIKANIKRRDKNNPYHRSSIDMVLLKEEANLPILIKVFASGVLINAKLVEIK